MNNLKRKFSNNGKLAHGEVLRGEDTLRIDVKRFTALQQIEKVIDDIERNPNVDIIKGIWALPPPGWGLELGLQMGKHV